MTQRASLPDLLRWMDLGSSIFLESVRRLGDDEVGEPSTLDPWTRGHLLAHVGFNAKALLNLVSWAKTGVRTPMYSSTEQRNEDIAAGGSWPLVRLRPFVEDTAAELAAELATMTSEAWSADIVTAQGRDVTATEIPWMRTREVAIHAVDLRTGSSFDQLPDDLTHALIADVVTKRSSRDGAPPLVVVADDGSRWQLGGTPDADEVVGRPQDLAAWLTGRSNGSGLRSTAPLPKLGPWL